MLKSSRGAGGTWCTSASIARSVIRLLDLPHHPTTLPAMSAVGSPSPTATPLRLRFRTDAPDDRRLRNASFRHRVLTRVPLAASGIPGHSEIVRASDVADD